jgi:hypothetical protein
MYELTPADVYMAFEKDIHWYRNVNWITYVKAEHRIKLGSPNSNRIFPFTLFSKGEGERPPDSTSSKMILWAPQKKIRVNDKKLEQIVMISLSITIMLYVPTSRHENLQLDPSCPPCTGKTHTHYIKSLEGVQSNSQWYKNCEVTTNYNKEFCFWV